MNSNDQFLILCNNLRQLRRKHGLSKKKMASILGIGVGSLTFLENDTIPSRLGCGFLFSASRYFGIRACDLFLPLDELNDA